MEECVKESLAAGIIHLSLSSVRASFFSLLKRKTRPCIDYSGCAYSPECSEGNYFVIKELRGVLFIGLIPTGYPDIAMFCGHIAFLLAANSKRPPPEVVPNLSGSCELKEGTGLML